MNLKKSLDHLLQLYRIFFSFVTPCQFAGPCTRQNPDLNLISLQYFNQKNNISFFILQYSLIQTKVSIFS